MIRAAIFDIDGTLVDTVDMHAEAWQRAFAEFGKQIDFKDIRNQIGKGGDQMLPVFFSDDELREFGKELEKRRGDIYKQDYMPQARAFPKVRELFELVRDDGKRIALASSAPNEELQYYKKLCNIEDLLEEETSADDAERSKPEPDIFEAAIQKLGDVDPQECIVIGDSPYDAEAAARAGMNTIGLLSGGFSNESLFAAGCIEIYRDPSQLLAAYQSSAIAM
ncbi:MAG: HAD family hydrolase [Pyrinomonadaceae bacterium]